MSDITIKFALTPKQKEVMAGFKRFTLWRAGRRGAKTRFAVYKQGKYALTHPKTINWYVAQETNLLNDEIIPLFKSIFGACIVGDNTKGHSKYLTLINGSKVFFKSANSNNSLRGRGLHSLVCEEAVFWQNGYTIYHDTLRPQLADYLGWSLLISSPPSKKCPKGAEWFRRMENLYQEELKNGSDQYAVFHSTIYDNPHIDKAEIEQIKKTCDPDTWTVEYMGEYCDNIGQVYWEFDPLEHKHAVDDKEPVLMRVRGLDFGIDDYTACAWVSLLPNNRVYVYDEYQANNLDVPTHAAAIRSKTTIPVQYSILDSACWARDASLTSVAKRFAEQGIGAVQATKDLDGSISDLKRLMANGLVIIDPKCTNLLRAIESWQHGQHEPDILAATRYAIDGLLRSGKLLAPIRNPKEDTRNVIEKVEDKHRRIERLNKALSAKKYNQSFYFHK